MPTQHTDLTQIAVIRMNQKGQLTIPKRLRERMRLTPGVPCDLLRLGDGLLLFRKVKSFEELCNEIASTLKSAGVVPQSLQGQLPKARKHIYAQRYGMRS